MNLVKSLLTLLCVCALMACAPSSSVSESASASSTSAASDKPNFGDASSAIPPEQAGASARSGTADTQLADASAPSAPPSVDNAQDTTRLDALYRSRTRGQAVTDYPIGPGDIVQVSVPPIDELRERTVRVEADGTISLPMLGTLQAGGLTEKQLRAEINERLKKYMYNPEVDVFVKEYRSRQVAVIGMVNNPGLITLTGPDETVLDMMTRAGGLTATAADEIILMPAEENKQQAIGRIAEVSASGADPTAALHNGIPASDASTAREAAFKRGELSALLRQNSHPLIIGLKSTALSGGGTYLNMPVRPGDVIVVPGGGEVMVVGWVQNPGHFQVGSGLTALGAIGAAGGPMFAADTSDVHLIRTRRDGSKLVLRIDLDKIKDGQEADFPVRGNDVIDVPYSSIKVGPYVFYQMLSKMAIGGPAMPTP
ncbi:MAG TPA: polysaccharide biosynthesis/export family protein [Candidatus Binataceae bacterium]|nr:polysaccharide biosynthesis/export family protein [Candidatus Binataceae bacterium]